MTEHQFLTRMIDLTNEMSDIYNAEPIDQVARKAVLDEIHQTAMKFNSSRHVSNCVINLVYNAAILFVLYVVYLFVSELWN